METRLKYMPTTSAKRYVQQHQLCWPLALVHRKRYSELQPPCPPAIRSPVTEPLNIFSPREVENRWEHPPKPRSQLISRKSTYCLTHITSTLRYRVSLELTERLLTPNDDQRSFLFFFFFSFFSLFFYQGPVDRPHYIMPRRSACFSLSCHILQLCRRSNLDS